MATDEKEVSEDPSAANPINPPEIGTFVEDASEPPISPKESPKSEKLSPLPVSDDSLPPSVKKKRQLIDQYPYLSPVRWSFPCIHPECTKVFDMTNDLYDHVRDHNRDLICPICRRSYSCMASLVYHARTHTKSKPYICPMPYCRFKTSTKGNLKAHLLSMKHTGDMRLDLLNVILSLDTHKPRPEIRMHGPREKKRKLTRSELERLSIRRNGKRLQIPPPIEQFKIDRWTQVHEIKAKQLEYDRQLEKTILIEQQNKYNIKIGQQQVKTMYEPKVEPRITNINELGAIPPPPKLPTISADPSAMTPKIQAGYFQALNKYQIPLRQRRPISVNPYQRDPYPANNYQHYQPMRATRNQYSAPPMPLAPASPVNVNSSAPENAIYGETSMQFLNPLKQYAGFEDYLREDDFDIRRRENNNVTMNKAVQEFKYIGGTGALYRL